MKKILVVAAICTALGVGFFVGRLGVGPSAPIAMPTYLPSEVGTVTASSYPGTFVYNTMTVPIDGPKKWETQKGKQIEGPSTFGIIPFVSSMVGNYPFSVGGVEQVYGGVLPSPKEGQKYLLLSTPCPGLHMITLSTGVKTDPVMRRLNQQVNIETGEPAPFDTWEYLFLIDIKTMNRGDYLFLPDKGMEGPTQPLPPTSQLS